MHGRPLQASRWIAPIAVVCALALPAPASAHPRAPTVALDYRLSVGATPPGVRVDVLDGDRDLRIRVRRGSTVVVRGDLGEPMLRIGPSGVFANRASVTAVAELLTTSGTGWRCLASGNSFAWHEHRLSPPPFVAGQLGPVARFDIPADLDGRRFTIAGTFFRVARPALWPWLAGALGGVAAMAVALRLLPALRRTAPVILGAAAGAASVTAYVAFSTADTTSGAVGWWSIGVVGALGAALAVALVRLDGSRRSHLAGVIGAAAAALDLGALGVFLHGHVVSSLPAGAARALCAVALVAGAAALAVSLLADEARPLAPKGAR